LRRSREIVGQTMVGIETQSMKELQLINEALKEQAWMMEK
jgi:hypothetical protein